MEEKCQTVFFFLILIGLMKGILVFRFLLLRLYSLWKIINIFSQCILNHGNAIPSDACIINSLIHTFISHTHTNLYILVLQNNKTKFMFKKENNNLFF